MVSGSQDVLVNWSSRKDPEGSPGSSAVWRGPTGERAVSKRLARSAVGQRREARGGGAERARRRARIEQRETCAAASRRPRALAAALGNGKRRPRHGRVAAGERKGSSENASIKANYAQSRPAVSLLGRGRRGLVVGFFYTCLSMKERS